MTIIPSLRGKSSEDMKKKSNVESMLFFKKCFRPGILRRQHSDSTSENEARARADPPSLLSSKQVLGSHKSDQRPKAQPLPLPVTLFANSNEPSLDGGPQNSPTPLLKSGHKRTKALAVVSEGVMATPSNSSYTSSDADDPCDLHLVSPQASDYENMRFDTTIPSGLRHSREMVKPANSLLNYRTSPISPKQRHKNCKVACSPSHHRVVLNTSDTPVSSPSRSLTRYFGYERAMEYGFCSGKQHTDITLQGCGQCSSPCSGHNSGNNSFTGDMPCQVVWSHCRFSPECSPLPSPRMTSPGPGSRIHSGGASPMHPRVGGTSEPSAARPDNGKQQSHPLPLPPVPTCNHSPFVQSYSPVTSPKIPRSPVRSDNPSSPTSCWKKGRALGRGTFGQVYLGFNSGSGEMCAMKEVTLFSDDAKSKESAHQLGKEVAFLSRLHHPNIVQYYGSEMVDDKLYIYLEYVSGGSIHKILQDYGQLGEAAIRSYTQQILSGLAYLHGKHTIHRDIKGANILVDPNGRVKLADFGMAKHISGQSCLSFKGSPYWMAPEVITNSSNCNLAVDIWSLGCTVLEMATAKPPWSQYEGVAALFKVGNSKELPEIPDHLSDEGKDFVMKCLQRNPSHRPTAAQLLEHPFIKNCSSLERPILGAEPLESIPSLPRTVKTMGSGRSRISHYLDYSEAVNHPYSPKVFPGFSDGYNVKSNSGPLYPSGNSLLYSPPPLHIKGRVFLYLSGASTPDDYNVKSNSGPLYPSGSSPLHSPPPLHIKGRVSPYPSGALTPPNGGPKATAIPPCHPNTTNLAHRPKIIRGLQKAHSSVEQLKREIDFFSTRDGKAHLMLVDQVGNPVRKGWDWN